MWGGGIINKKKKKIEGKSCNLGIRINKRSNKQEELFIAGTECYKYPMRGLFLGLDGPQTYFSLEVQNSSLIMRNPWCHCTTFICDTLLCTSIAAFVHFQVNSGRRRESLRDEEGLDDDAFGETIEVSFFLQLPESHSLEAMMRPLDNSVACRES